jgi:hypothetical protein
MDVSNQWIVAMNKDNGARTYFEKLKIAEKFCFGDIEMAKKILKGEFADIIVIKGRFKDDVEEYFGLFLMFISRLSRSVIHSNSVISHTASVYYNKPFESWKIFFNKLEREIKEAQINEERTKILNEVLSRLQELKLFNDFFEWITHNEIMNLTEKFQKIICNVLNVENSHVVLDFENITSIILYEEKGIKPV